MWRKIKGKVIFTLYLLMGLTFVWQYLSGGNTRVTDATGTVWQTGDIHETAAIVTAERARLARRTAEVAPIIRTFEK